MGMAVDHPSPPHRGSAGMTLVELVMVIAIMGIVAAVTMVKFFGNDLATDGSMTLCQEPPKGQVAYCLTEALRTAQRQAMLVAPGYSVVHASGQPSYYNTLDANGTLMEQIGPIPPKISISPFTVSFDGLGRPTGAGDITITEALDAEPFTSTIGIVHIENNTGAVWMVPHG